MSMASREGFSAGHRPAALDLGKRRSLGPPRLSSALRPLPQSIENSATVCGKVAGTAGSDEVSVDDDFLVHPFGTRVDRVVFDGVKARQGPPLTMSAEASIHPA
jgi:hypothetical protein